MSAALPARGREALERVLASGPRHVTDLGPDAFRGWLAAQRTRAEHDPVYRQRVVVRDLERSHRAGLEAARKVVADTLESYVACGCASDLDDQAVALRGLGKAVEGLRGAVARGDAEPDKLADYETRAATARARYERAIAACAERGALDRARQRVLELEQSIGLDHARAELAQLNRTMGQRRSTQGERYEAVAGTWVQDLLVPELRERHDGPLRVLHGATLGCARGEFDHLVVAVSSGEEATRVLAIVESKRNLDDLGHGYRLRSENLAWFQSRDGYDPEAYRTHTFVTGHFDRAVVEQTPDGPLTFDPSSFADFDATQDLWFVTEERPLSGLSSRELQMLRHRLSTDLDLDPDHPAGVESVRAWLTEIAAPIQAADVLRLYLESNAADRILLTRPQTPGEHRR